MPAILENVQLHMKNKTLLVTNKMRRQISGAIAEIDLTQMALVREMTPAERVRQAASMIDAAERVGAYRLRQRDPTLHEDDALKIIRGGLLNYHLKQKPWRKNKPVS
jgi:hypothetical protein